MGEGPRWLGGTLYGWGGKRGGLGGGCVGWGGGGGGGGFGVVWGGDMDIYWGTNTTLRVMGVLHGWLHHHRPWIDIYIYIHSCDLSSVGDDRGGGCMVMTYWPVDGWGHPRSTPERSSVSAPWPPNFRH